MSQEAQNLYSRGKTAASGELTHLLGQIGMFKDVDRDATDQVKPVNSGRMVRCRWVKNNSGGALLPRLAVKYELGEMNNVDAVAGADEVPAGVVDEFLPAAGVADGEHFWIVEEGPTEVVSVAAFSAGDVLATFAGGKVDTHDATGDVTIALAAFARALAAATGADENIRAVVNIRVH